MTCNLLCDFSREFRERRTNNTNLNNTVRLYESKIRTQYKFKSIVLIKEQIVLLYE